MRKFVLTFALTFGLTQITQAQTLCDYTYHVGAQTQLEVAIPTTGNGIITAYPLYAVAYGGGTTIAEDSCNGGPYTLDIYNSLLEDTITTCITYVENNVDTLTCCFDLYWDGLFWQRQMMFQQSFSCDSIIYTAGQGSSMFEVSLSNYNPVADSLDIFWSVCNTSTCYSGEGQFNAFPQVILTDTLKVCYDAFYYYSDTTVLCNHCDSMVYSQLVGDWILYSTEGNTTGISELVIDRVNDNKIYDMLVRELNEIPVGTMYIRNQQLYITK